MGAYLQCVKKAKAILTELTTEELESYIDQVLNKSKSSPHLSSLKAIQEAMLDVNNQRIQSLMGEMGRDVRDAQKLGALEAPIISKKIKMDSLIAKGYQSRGNNIEAAQNSQREDLGQYMFRPLDSEDVAFLQDKNNQMDIANAYDGKQYKSKTAKKIGDLLHKYFRYRNKKMVMSDAMPIYFLNEDRTFRGLHEVDKMIEKGKDMWKASILKSINKLQTFRRLNVLDPRTGDADPVKVDAILNQIFEGITEDKHNMPEYRKLVDKMTFVFKDMTSQLEYNNEFGRGDLFSALKQDIHSSGNTIGAADMFGSDPYAMYEKLKETQARVNPQKAGWQHDTDRMMDFVMGVNQNSIRPSVSRFLGNTRAFTSAMKSIPITIIALTDPVFQAGYVMRVGGSYLKHLGYQTIHAFNLLPSALHKSLAKDFKTMFDMEMGYTGRMMDAENVSEVAQKVSAWSYFASGLHALDRGYKLGNMAWWAKSLWRDRKLAWESLNSQKRKKLQQFDIEKHEWNGLKGKGHKWFTMDNIKALSNDELKTMWEKSDKNVPFSGYKDVLYRKFYALFKDAADNGVYRPEVSMMVKTTHAVKRGTIPGEIIRQVMQFKSFALTYADKALYQGFKDMETPTAKVAYAVALATGTIAYNYAQLMIKNLGQGKSMPDPSKMNTQDRIKFYAELIAGHYYMLASVLDPRHQNSDLITTALFNGPSLRAISDVLAAIGAAVTGGKHVKKKTYKAAAALTPIDNIPWFSPMLREWINEKSYLEKGQKQLYGK